MSIVVGIFDDVEVMFDHDHHMAGIHQAMQDTDQTLDVREVESVVGSSSKKHASFRLPTSSVASFRRWASPPLQVCSQAVQA